MNLEKCSKTLKMVKESIWRRWNKCDDEYYTRISPEENRAYVEKKFVWRKKRGSTSSSCVPVRVGEEGNKYCVPIRYLSHPLFRNLLEKAREEYGFQQGVITIPCNVDQFQQILW